MKRPKWPYQTHCSKKYASFADKFLNLIKEFLPDSKIGNDIVKKKSNSIFRRRLYPVLWTVRSTNASSLLDAMNPKIFQTTKLFRFKFDTQMNKCRAFLSFSPHPIKLYSRPFPDHPSPNIVLCWVRFPCSCFLGSNVKERCTPRRGSGC